MGGIGRYGIFVGKNKMDQEDLGIGSEPGHGQEVEDWQVWVVGLELEPDERQVQKQYY